MRTSPQGHRAVLALMPFLLLAGCGRTAEQSVTAFPESGDILEHVPADTPYVLAAVKRLPADVRGKLEGIYGGFTFEAARASLLRRIEEAASAPDVDPDRAARARAVGEELARLLTLEGLEEAGLSLGNPGALYGVGLVPVIRVEVSDGARLEAAIARLEEKAQAPMARADARGLAYRYAGDEDARVLLALDGRHLVLALSPAELTEEQVASVLGAEPPAQHLADAGHLTALAADFGFTPYLSGYLDVQRIAAIVSGEPEGINAAVLHGAAESPETLSETCRQEIRTMAAIAPRVVAGYTEVSTERFAGNVVVELREDVAASLTRLRAPVPGLGTDHGGAVSLGIGLDLLGARNFYEAQLRAITADPFECELFAELQESAANGLPDTQLPVPPIAYSIDGFLAVIDRVAGMDVAAGQPPQEVDMRVLVATGDAPALVALAALFSPDVAAMNLQPDGRAREVDLPPLGQPFTSATVALTDDALGMAVGAGAGPRIESLIAAPPADPPPVLSLHMDMRRYYELMAESLAAGAVNGTDRQLSPEEAAALREAMTAFANRLGRLGYSILLTERGIEMPAVVTLAGE